MKRGQVLTALGLVLLTFTIVVGCSVLPTTETDAGQSLSRAAVSVTYQGESQAWTTSDTASKSSAYVTLQANAVGDYFQFSQTPSAGTYSVTINYFKKSSYGTHAFSVNGAQLGSAIDAYASGSSDVAASVNLGTVAISGSSVFKFTVTGKNAAASDYDFRLDSVALTATGATAPPTTPPTATPVPTATPTPTAVPSVTPTKTPSPTPTATPVVTPAPPTPTPGPTLTPAPTGTPGPINYGPVGFCNDGSVITGGAAGPTVFVSTEAQLQQYSDVNDPYTIYITANFNLTGMATHIRSNKTVIGQGNITLTGGGLYLYKSSNVIIRNLTITGSSEDNIGIHYSDHVWIDHCTLSNSTDGNVDITQQSDYITLSWNKFFYTVNNGHNFVSLIASSDADNGSQYHVTYHHNWWGEGCVERMPSVRFGRVHVFNNYYNAPGNNYCVRTRVGAELRVENNFFEGVQNPWEQYVTGSGDLQGKLFASGNSVALNETTNGVTWTGNVTHKDGTVTNMLPGTDSVFATPYSYAPDSAASTKTLVTGNAGAGHGPFAQ